LTWTPRSWLALWWLLIYQFLESKRISKIRGKSQRIRKLPGDPLMYKLADLFPSNSSCRISFNSWISLSRPNSKSQLKVQNLKALLNLFSIFFSPAITSFSLNFSLQQQQQKFFFQKSKNFTKISKNKNWIEKWIWKCKQWRHNTNVFCVREKMRENIFIVYCACAHQY
jgi:hypothetical protein